MAPGGTADTRRLSRSQCAIAAALHVAIAVALLHNAWADPGGSAVGPAVIDGAGYGAGGIVNGDSLQLVWFMRWTPFAVSHLHDPLLTTWMNAPRGANLMWDALMPVAGLLLAPVTYFAGPIVSFNLLATLALALCGLVATACARRVARVTAAAIAGGVAFECSPFLVAQSQGHQSIVLAAAFVPFLLLVVVDVARGARSVRAGGLMLGLAAAATFYTWEETLLGAALIAALGVLVAAAVAFGAVRSTWRRVATGLAIALGVGGVTALPGLLVQFAGPMHVAGGAIRDPNHWVVDLQNLVTPTARQVLAPPVAVSASHHWTGNSFEWGGYVGLPLLIVCVTAAFVLWRRREVRWLSTMTVIGVVLSLGPSLHVGGTDIHVPLPWAVIAHVPLVQDVLAARLALFPALAVALLFALAVDGLIAWRRHAAAIATAVLVGLSLLPAALPAETASSPAFFTGGAVDRIHPGDIVLVAPYATPLVPQPMIWQAASGMRFRMPEGYVSLSGPGGGFLESPPATTTSAAMESVQAGAHPVVSAGLRAAMLADLRGWGVHTVLVGPMPHSEAMITLFTSLLATPPVYVGGVACWWNV